MENYMLKAGIKLFFTGILHFQYTIGIKIRMGYISLKKNVRNPKNLIRTIIAEIITKYK
jgi:hypothetical protein